MNATLKVTVGLSVGLSVILGLKQDKGSKEEEEAVVSGNDWKKMRKMKVKGEEQKASEESLFTYENSNSRLVSFYLFLLNAWNLFCKYIYQYANMLMDKDVSVQKSQ